MALTDTLKVDIARRSCICPFITRRRDADRCEHSAQHLWTLGDSSPHTLLEILVKKNILLVLVTLLVAMFAAACSPPTPEKLCEGVDRHEEDAGRGR